MKIPEVSISVEGTTISIDRSKRTPRYVIALVGRPDVPPIKISAKKFCSEDELRELVLAWVSLYRTAPE